MGEEKILEDGSSVEELLSSIRKLVYPSFSLSDDCSISRKEGPDKTEEGDLSSFVRIVQAQESQRPWEKTVEGFLADLLKEPLAKMVEDRQRWIQDLIQKSIHIQLSFLLQEWLNRHLPQIVRDCVREHLERLQRNAPS